MAGKNPYLHIYALTVFVAMFIEWWIFGQTIDAKGINPVGNFLKYFGEGAVIISPLYLLGRKWKRVTLAIIWFISLCMLCNAMYFRFWGDIMGMESLMLWKNVNPVLLNSLKGVVKVGDAIFIAVPLLMTLEYVCRRRRIEALDYRGIRNKSIILMAIALFISVSQLSYTLSDYRYGHSIGMDTGFTEALTQRFTTPIFKNQHEYKKLGGFCFSAKSTFLVLRDHRTIQIDDTSGIDAFLSGISQKNRTGGIVSDSLVSANSDKNIIVIVVESLNADVIGERVEGHSVTQVLDSLLTEDGTISSLNMLTQVNKGGSSDGQLLINTGLLPISSGAASMIFSDHIVMPSLAKAMKKEVNIAIFADDAKSWRQREVYSNFGFGRIYSSDDFQSQKEIIGSDGAMFRFGERIISEIRGTFFIEFISFSMHVPFIEKAVEIRPWLENADELTEIERNYLNSVSYFDSELGNFISWLRNNDLYDNSLIVIVSDHSQSIKESYEDDIYSKDMAFIALNTGLKARITAKTGQVNVYPTILQLTGAGIPGYYGLGKSLLDPSLCGALDPAGIIHGDASEVEMMKRAYNVSDSIIRGDYFRIKQAR